MSIDYREDMQREDRHLAQIGYRFDPVGNMVAQPLPEINDVHGLEIPAQPDTAAQLEHASARIDALEIQTEQLAEAVVKLARDCHELARLAKKMAMGMQLLGEDPQEQIRKDNTGWQERGQD